EFEQTASPMRATVVHLAAAGPPSLRPRRGRRPRAARSAETLPGVRVPSRGALEGLAPLDRLILGPLPNVGRGRRTVRSGTSSLDIVPGPAGCGEVGEGGIARSKRPPDVSL